MKNKHITRSIALAELQTLFYSPVAWLVLILFAFQSGMAITGLLNEAIKAEALNYQLSNLTFSRFSDILFGFFPRVLGYLHLYIPLLTMGLMSRELSSGSIKLLFSSPVKNIQIILGKFMSMAIFGLMLMSLIFICVLTASFTIKNFDWSLVLCGMLGIYLLIMAYIAIGLFMSSLTSYQVIAAIATIALLSLLNFVGSIGQSIDMVREITYWLSLKGRTDQPIQGLLCSEDVLYFLIIIVLFLTLSVLRLNAIRQKAQWVKTWFRYVLVVAAAMMLGYLSSRPIWMAYYDATRTKQQSLTKGSQDIVKQVKGGLTLTTYVNIFDNDSYQTMPKMRKSDIRHFEKYIRFKPEMKVKYVYYYAPTAGSYALQYNPTLSHKELMEKIVKNEDGLDPRKILTIDEVNKLENLSSEGYRLVRVLERDNGDKVFLRMFDDAEKYPGEREISAALKRLIMKQPPIVAFLQGHGERNFDLKGDRSYHQFAMNKSFRYALINQGFKFAVATLDSSIPENINLLVIADMKKGLNEQEQAHLSAYIKRGGNLVIMGETRRQVAMNPLLAQFGVELLPGQLVQLTAEDYNPDFIIAHATPEAEKLSYFLGGADQFKVTMPGTVGLSYRTGMGYTIMPILVTNNKNVWNEQDSLDFINHTPTLNPERGEKENVYPTALALTRNLGIKQQKIIVTGDADCISNGEISNNRPGLPAANYGLILGTFNWMSNNEFPIDVRRPSPTDNNLTMGMAGAKLAKALLMWIFPAILLLGYLILWMRRRKR